MTEHFRVLIVDDLSRTRQSLRAWLATWPGLDSVREAPDAEHALELMESDCPDIVLMDVGMPGMDGLEATRRIKATRAGKATPIAAVTASALVEEREAILAAARGRSARGLAVGNPASARGHS